MDEQAAYPDPAMKPVSRPGLIRRLLRWTVRLVLGFMLASVAIVLVYRFVPPPVTITMIANAIDGDGLSKDWMSLDRMDPAMARAAIAGEDDTFCRHHGFNFDAIQKAIAHNERSKRLRGGSTISQQTAKNVFLWQGRSWVRKGFETWFTILIEGLWGKRRIMETYLNVAETGIGTYGANAGAQRYYHHDATRLSVMEASRIAAILPLPQKRGAVAPQGFTRRYGNRIAARMVLVHRMGLDSCVR